MNPTELILKNFEKVSSIPRGTEETFSKFLRMSSVGFMVSFHVIARRALALPDEAIYS